MIASGGERVRTLVRIVRAQPGRSTAVGLFAVMTVALCFLAMRTGDAARYWDEQVYLSIADSIARGEGYSVDGHPTAYRPPVWPLILAIGPVLHLPAWYSTLVPVIILAVAAVVAGLLARRITGSDLGAVAAFGVLLYPLNAYTATTVYPQTLALLAIVLLWWIAAKYCDGGDRTVPVGIAACAGLLVPVLALSVPTLAPTGFMVLAWLIYKQRSGRIKFTITSLLGCLIPFAIWSTRNFVTMGSFVPISTSTGRNLLLGNSENTTPTSGVNVDVSKYSDGLEGLTEVEQNGLLTQHALNWIFSNPGDAVVLYLGKLLNYFNAYNDPVTAGQGSDFEKYISWFALVFLAIGLVARFMLRRHLAFSPSEKLFLAVFFLNAPIMAAVFTRVRFRQPLDIILIIEVAVAIVIIAKLYSARRNVKSLSWV